MQHLKKRSILLYSCLLLCLSFFSCVGHRLFFRDKGISSEEEALTVIVNGRKTGSSNKVKSLTISLNYGIEKNNIPYTFTPDNFKIDIVYPQNCKSTPPIVSKCTGALRYLRTEPFTLEGKKSIEVKVKIETDEEFNLDSLDIRLLPTGFVNQKGKPVFSDTLNIGAMRVVYSI